MCCQTKTLFIHLAFDSMNICMAKQTHHAFKPNAIKNAKIYPEKKFLFSFLLILNILVSLCN